MDKRDALEDHFAPFRAGTIGRGQTFRSPFGVKKIVYADWTASGRAYGPIEETIRQQVLPYFGNSHTKTTITGTRMTNAYDEAKVIIKKHVGADENDALLFCGSGMTSAVNKLQRLMGLRAPENLKGSDHKMPARPDDLVPVVFISGMEHHSNHISWLETMATVEILDQDEDYNIDLKHVRELLNKFKTRKHKIAAITACSNVTGIQTCYHEIAKLMHAEDGLCFVDFAASAPYAWINMHPAEDGSHLDAIYFSMHKFLGGPGTPGVLIFNQKIVRNKVPDHPGGGTILYSNPWGERHYVDDIELREDGGTPPLVQGIKAAMCIRLKEKMGVENILSRETELTKRVLDKLSNIPGLSILQGKKTDRLGIISFTIASEHYNFIVRVLNDRFGIQARGGCSCAGTYGHLLLNVDQATSIKILNALLNGDMSAKPGWVRISLHPTMTNDEVDFITDAIAKTVLHAKEWAKDYLYDESTNEFIYNGKEDYEDEWIGMLFGKSKVFVAL